MTTLLIATRNAHKVGEIQAILGPAFRFLTLNDFPAAPAVVEDAPTFAGNAAKKAIGLARWLGENRPAARPPRTSCSPMTPARSRCPGRRAGCPLRAFRGPGRGHTRNNRRQFTRRRQ